MSYRQKPHKDVPDTGPADKIKLSPGLKGLTIGGFFQKKINGKTLAAKISFQKQVVNRINAVAVIRNIGV